MSLHDFDFFFAETNVGQQIDGMARCNVSRRLLIQCAKRLFVGR